MLIIHLKGPVACGKTTMATQIRKMLNQEGLTWKERLAFWLLKNSAWNKFIIHDSKIFTDCEPTDKAIQNMRKNGVKILIIDGGM